MKIHCKHVVRWTMQLSGFQYVVRVAFFFTSFYHSNKARKGSCFEVRVTVLVSSVPLPWQGAAQRL